jgi:hypothetical protein
VQFGVLAVVEGLGQLFDCPSCLEEGAEALVVVVVPGSLVHVLLEGVQERAFHLLALGVVASEAGLEPYDVAFFVDFKVVDDTHLTHLDFFFILSDEKSELEFVSGHGVADGDGVPDFVFIVGLFGVAGFDFLDDS